MPRLWCLVMLTAAAQAAVVEDFERPQPWAVHLGAERGASYAAVAAPAPRGLSGQLAWQVPHHSYEELHLARPLPLPAFDQGLNGTLSVWVATPQPTAIGRVALRLRDAKGEIFQFSETADLRSAGWHQLVYRLRPELAKESWGAKDGVVDLPVSLLGFSVSFTAAATQPGAIYFDDVATATPGRDVDTRRPLWRFDDQERWSVHTNYAAVAKLVREDGRLLLDVTPGDKELGIPLWERSFSVKPVGSPQAVTLRCELLAGTGSRFTLRLRDRGGEIHQFRGQPLVPGANTVTWRIPEDRSQGTWGDNLDERLDPPLSLHELFVSQAPGAAPVRIRLIDAELAVRRPLLEAIRVDVETGNPVHVLRVGEEDRLGLRLASEVAEPVQVQAVVELEDFAGETVTSTHDVALPARGEALVKLPRVPAGQGIWWVNYTLRDPAGGAELRGRRSYAHLAPAGPTPGRAEGFLFSICTHTERWPEADQANEVLAAALCGAKVIRTGPGWSAVQPTADTWNWEPMDRMVARYAAQGMEIQHLLGFNPQWAAPPEWRNADWLTWSRKMPQLDAWRAWCTAVATRYRDRIRYWEVWNEPDIGFWRGTLDEYLLLLQTAYESIKAVDPALQVMTGGFAIYDRNPQFIEAVVDRGQAWFDIFAYHRHGGFAPFAAEVDGPVAAMRARLKPPRPIYFNETAVSSVEGGERHQAMTLFKKLTFAWSRGSIGYTWYDLRNDGFDPKDYEHNYGMVTNDFYPKAVYATYNELVRRLRGKTYEQELSLGAGRYGFVFRDGGEQVVCAWSEPSAGPARHVILQTDATAAATVDLMGNRTPAPVLPGGRVVLVTGANPAYLVLSGARAKVALVGPLADLGGPYVAVPGRRLELTARFRNPLAAASRLAVSWTGPAGWTVEPATTTVELAPGGEATLRPGLLVAPTPGQRATPRGELTLRYEAPGTPLAGAVTVPVEVATVLDDQRADRPADFVLDTRASYVTLFGNDPQKSHLVWRDAADLSAQVWLTRVQGALELRVVVTDDRHVQPRSAAESWQSDGLQVALAVPGQPGHWEFSLARADDGRPLLATSIRPDGAADPAGQLQLTTTPGRAGGVAYTLRLPDAACGVTSAALEAGLRFNVLVNDDDGEGREGWLELAGGIGQRKDASLFPVVVF